MYGANTRAAMRDQVRRRLDQIPPIDDDPTQPAGAQPMRWPWPHNALLDAAIDDAVAFFSRKVKMAGDPLPRTIPIAAVSDYGPYAVDLQTIAPFGSVNEVRRSSWQPAGGSEFPLRSWDRQEMDRLRYGWMNTPPGTPRWCWYEAGSLMLYPAPAAAGSLLVMLGVALWTHADTSDGETLEIIPADHLPAVVAKAAHFVCTAPAADAELARLAPVLLAEVGDGLADMRALFSRRNRPRQPGMMADVGRVGYYGQRR